MKVRVNKLNLKKGMILLLKQICKEKRLNKKELKSFRNIAGAIVDDITSMAQIAERIAVWFNGALIFVDGVGFDFLDGSDSKVATTYMIANNPRPHATIKDVGTKTGTLRIIIHDLVNGRLRFYKIPRAAYIQITKQLSFCLDGKSKYAQYEVKSLVELYNE